MVGAGAVRGVRLPGRVSATRMVIWRPDLAIGAAPRPVWSAVAVAVGLCSLIFWSSLMCLLVFGLGAVSIGWACLLYCVIKKIG
jgi:hypothetical protein